MSSKKKRLKTKINSIPTLKLLQYKSFNMIDGKFKGGNIHLVDRNPHGRWSVKFFKSYNRGGTIGNFIHRDDYIDENEFFLCVEPTPELLQFKRDLTLNKILK